MMTQLQKLLSLVGMFGNPGIPLANRNHFIDGAFDNFYGSTPVTVTPGASGYYGTSIWKSVSGTGGQATCGTVDMRLQGGPWNESGTRNYVQWSQTTAATTTPWFAQFQEMVHRFAGKSVTFSCKLWCASGTVTISQIIAQQSFGTGGSPSPNVNIDKPVNWVVTPAVQKFSVRLDLPSIAGKVFGTNGSTDYTLFGLYFPTGVTFTMGMAEFQLENCNPNSSSDINGSGGAPTTFEYRGVGPEFTRLQRFYQQVTVDCESYQAAGQNLIAGVMLPTNLRALPAATLITAYGIGGVGAAPTIYTLLSNRFTLSQLCATTGTSYFVSGVHALDARF
jgi:hypothetical protein